MKTKTKKPSKQRKMIYDAPDHKRGVLLSAHLSPELKDTYNTRALPMRKGDTIRVYRGDYKGYEGKILRIDRQNYIIFVEGINREKADGTSILVPIHPSKVEVLRLNLDDKRRNTILKRKGATEEDKVPVDESSEKVEAAKPKETKLKKTSKVKGEKKVGKTRRK